MGQKKNSVRTQGEIVHFRIQKKEGEPMRPGKRGEEKVVPGKRNAGKKMSSTCAGEKKKRGALLRYTFPSWTEKG